MRGRLGPLSADQELAIETLTRGIVNKIMHTPISTLKTAAREPESTTVIDLVRRLFNLNLRSEDEKERKVHSKSDGNADIKFEDAHQEKVENGVED